MPNNSASPRRRRGYTLIEILVSTALMALVMTGVGQIMVMVNAGVNDSRAGMEMAGNLRTAGARLENDLTMTTAPLHVAPPHDPGMGTGYFEYVEGPIGPVLYPKWMAQNSDAVSDDRGDTSVGDTDDMILFTARSEGVPFRGRGWRTQTVTNGPPIGPTHMESHEAEITWFLRGTTLYRRVLLIAPQIVDPDSSFCIDLNSSGNPGDDGMVGPQDLQRAADLTDSIWRSFHEICDVSARPVRSGGGTHWIPNTLADLAKRENRFAHRLVPMAEDGSQEDIKFPFDACRMGALGLPTVQEMAWSNRSGDTLYSDAERGSRSFWPGGSRPDYWMDWNGNDIEEDIKRSPRIRPWNPIRDYWLEPHNWGDFTTFSGDYPNGVTIMPQLDGTTGLPDPATGITDRATGIVKDCVMGRATLDNDGDGVYETHANATLAARRAARARVGEDVILTNVISFDVKAWDPGAPIKQYDTSSSDWVAVEPGDTVAPNEVNSSQYQSAYLQAVAAGNTNRAFGAYVDLNYMCWLGPKSGAADLPNYTPTNKQPAPYFHHAGYPMSGLQGVPPADSDLNQLVSAIRNSKKTDKDPAYSRTLWENAGMHPAVYDTWSSHYEVDGIDQHDDGEVDLGANGLDDDDNEVIDNIEEAEAPPPYPVPLKGIQITIRTFEPDSRQIREITIEHVFEAK